MIQETQEGRGFIATIEWTITTVTDRVFIAVQETFRYILHLPCYCAQKVLNGVRRITPEYNAGTIPSSIVGTAASTYFVFMSRKAIVDGIITKMTGLACEILGKGEFATTVAKAGMTTLYSGEHTHVAFVLGGGILGGVGLLLINGVVYKLFFDRPEHKEILDLVQAEGDNAKQETTQDHSGDPL